MKKPKTIYLGEELEQFLNKLAKKEDRSVNQVIIHILEKYVRGEKK